jgi:hypothetical protein
VILEKLINCNSAKDKISRLFREIKKLGYINEGSPYSRAQNTMEHCGFAALIAIIFLSFGLEEKNTLLSVLCIGVLWEVR